MKGRVDKLMGIVTLITETSAKITAKITVHMQENQTDKVIIDMTRSVHGDWHENHWVRRICVDLTIMEYLFSDRIFQKWESVYLNRIKKGEDQGKEGVTLKL